MDDTYWELVADDEDIVRFTANTKPLLTLHLVEDALLEAGSRVFKLLWAHAPKNGIESKC